MHSHGRIYVYIYEFGSHLGCSGLGRRNNGRAQFAGSYEDKMSSTGTSGPTYQHGYKAVTWIYEDGIYIDNYIYLYIECMTDT